MTRNWGGLNAMSFHLHPPSWFMRQTSHRTLTVVQRNQAGGALGKCRGDLQQIDGACTDGCGGQARQALRFIPYVSPVEVLPDQAAVRKVAGKHGHRRSRLFGVDLGAKSLQTQRVPDLDLLSSLDYGKHGGEPVLDMPYVERLHVVHNATYRFMSTRRRPSAVVAVRRCAVAVAVVGLRRVGKSVLRRQFAPSCVTEVELVGQGSDQPPTGTPSANRAIILTPRRRRIC